MADFKAALTKVLHHEGGYVCDPADKGGETIFGVARKAHPDCAIWKDVDLYKTSINFTNTKDKRRELETLCKGNTNFMQALEAFYKTKFWDKIKGDDIASQKVAEFFFDYVVNSGTGKIKDVQKLLGVNADGAFGAQSLAALNEKGDGFFNTLLEYRRNFYKRIVERDPSQQKFFKGWNNRLDAYC